MEAPSFTRGFPPDRFSFLLPNAPARLFSPRPPEKDYPFLPSFSVFFPHLRCLAGKSVEAAGPCPHSSSFFLSQGPCGGLYLFAFSLRSVACSRLPFLSSLALTSGRIFAFFPVIFSRPRENLLLPSPGSLADPRSVFPYREDAPPTSR